MTDRWNNGAVRRNGEVLDEVDEQLIELLRADGRASNRSLASELGMAETTVSARIRRLADANIMRVVAVTDTEAFGFDVMCVTAVQVEGRSHRDVGADLAEIPEVVSVTLVLGPYDIVMTVLARDRDHLREVLDQIASTPGVRDIDTELALDVLTYRSEWAVFDD